MQASFLMAITRFGKYYLIHRLAVGGMAEIFLAKQKGLEGFEKTICIKRIRPHLSSQPNFVRMFLNEAKLVVNLSHPNIVQIYDLGKVGESYFIAMEYVSGRDMSRIIPKARKKKIPFPVVYALKIASDVLDGLYYAHNAVDTFGNLFGIVHRDVTPENIIVGYNGTVKLADFGIAKANTQLGQTKAGEIKGKLSYMSPEQAMGHDLDHRSDIFSLGAILYEWVTGTKLFSGDGDMAVLKSIIEGKIYPPTYFNKQVPKPVEDILMKALEKDRDKRYQSGWDMQRDINAYIATTDFSPSNMHLSNFLKQLFEKEIEQEKELLIRSRELHVDYSMSGSHEIVIGHDDVEMSTVAGQTLVLDSEDAVVASLISEDGDVIGNVIEVAMSDDELKVLKSMADKSKSNVASICAEMIKSHLKWAK